MSDDDPVGLLALDEAGMRLRQVHERARRLAHEAQDAALALVEGVASDMRDGGIDARDIEWHTGLPAATVREALESGEMSLATFCVIARAAGFDVALRRRL